MKWNFNFLNKKQSKVSFHRGERRLEKKFEEGYLSLSVVRSHGLIIDLALTFVKATLDTTQPYPYAATKRSILKARKIRLPRHKPTIMQRQHYKTILLLQHLLHDAQHSYTSNTGLRATPGPFPLAGPPALRSVRPVTNQATRKQQCLAQATRPGLWLLQ